MSTQGGILQSLGFNLSDSAALIGQLTKAGVSSTTVVKSMSAGLIKLTKDGEAPADAFKRVTTEIQGMVDSGNEAAALQRAGEVFGTRGAPQLIAALKTGSIDLQNMTEAAGITDDTILGLGEETLHASEQWTILKNRATEALEPIGTKVFDFADNVMGHLLDRFDDVQAGASDLWAGLTMDAATRAEFEGQTSGLVAFGSSVREVFDGVAETVGPLIQDTFAEIVPIFSEVGSILGPAIVDVFDSLKPAFKELLPIISDLLPLFNPFSLIFHALLPVLPQIAEVVGDLARTLGSFLGSALKAVAPIFQKLVDVVNRFMPMVADLVARLLPPLVKLFDKVAPLLDAVLAALLPVVDALIDALIPAIDALMPIVERVFDFIASSIGNVIDFFGGLIDFITGVFTGDWEMVWTGIKDMFGAIWQQIQDAVSFAWDFIVELFTNLGPKLGEIINDLLTTVGEWGVQFLTWLWDGIKSVWPALQDWFTALPGWIWDRVKAAAGTVAGWGLEFLQWLWNGIQNKAEEVWAWFTALPGWIWDRVKAAAGTVAGWGLEFLQWLWNGIQNKAEEVYTWFTNLPGVIWEKAKSAFAAVFDWGVQLVKDIIAGIEKAAPYLTAALAKAVTEAAGAIVPGFDLALDIAGIDLGGNIDQLFGTGRAAGGVIPGVDPGRRDNVLTPMRSGESVFVPEFTRAIGGAPTVHAWNRLAEQGRLGEIGMGFARGGVIGAVGNDIGVQMIKSLIPQLAESVTAGSEDALAGQFVVDGILAPLPEGTRGDFMKAVASKMGSSYVWGAAGPTVFDCSGLMSWAMTEAGAGIGRLTAENFNSRFPHISSAKPGDMVTFDTGRIPGKAGHIGAVLDPARGLMMHTDGAGPARVSDYTRRDGGPLSIIDPIGGSAGVTIPDTFIGKLLKGAIDRVGGLVNNAIGPSPEGAGVERWRSLGLQALKAVGDYLGRPLTQHIDRMLYQMQTESGGDPNAVNNWDSNAQRGTPSKGLLQVIQPTFETALRNSPFANLIGRGTTDPWANMIASIMYGEVTGPYHSLARAYRGVAYSTGGIVQDSGQFMGAPVGTDTEPAWLTPGEAVLTAPMWATAEKAIGYVASMANKGGVNGSGPLVSVERIEVTSGSAKDVTDELMWKSRLALRGNR